MGDTPLHRACRDGDENEVRKILKGGIGDINIKGIAGKTPLHLASLRGHEAVAKLLLESGADANSRQKDKKTPLHLASQNGHEVVAKLLLESGADVNSRGKNGRTPLHLASLNGHEAVAKLLLESGADANSREENGGTPLHLASENGHEAVAILLLETGAYINSRNVDESTPFHLASQNGHEAVAKLLLESGADAKSREEDEWTSLHLASQNGHEALAKLLLECGADVNSREKDECTPLHWASHNGHEAVAKLLLENGADVNSRQKDRRTPLHLASQNGHDAVAKLLLESGADVNSRQNVRMTPLHLASKNGHEAMAKLLLDCGADINSRQKDRRKPLHYASYNGHEAVTKLLLDSGADINSRQKDRRTPLHLASHNGHEAVAKLLLESGADVNCRKEDGWTPLHIASMYGHQALVKLLLESGADVNSRNADGWTPLHPASSCDHEAVAKLLLEGGADVNSKGKVEYTPLHLASQNGHEAVAKLLLESGADVNSRGKNGRTPLHQASQNGHEAVAKLLLESGADANSREENGRTPLHLASYLGHEAVAKLLLDNGADVNSREKDKWTPLHLASQNGHEAVAKLLLESGADANRKGKFEMTPLHLVSINGHEAVVKQLLDNGANVYSECPYGALPTPQHLALQYGYEEVANILLDNRTALENRNDTNLKLKNTPLHLVCKSGDISSVLSLLQKGISANIKRKDGCSLLHLASENGHEAVTKLLLARGADVNSRDKEGLTPLHLASQNGHEAVANLLLDSGAHVNSRTKNDFTPIHMALENDHTSVIHLLIDKGATDVPPEIIVRGKDAVKIYQDAVQNGVLSDKRCRMLVVGAERVGKTSLIKLLTGKKFNPHENSTHLINVVNVKTSSPLNTWEECLTKDGTTHSEQEYQDAYKIAKNIKITWNKKNENEMEKELDFVGVSRITYGSSQEASRSFQIDHSSIDTGHGASQAIHYLSGDQPAIGHDSSNNSLLDRIKKNFKSSKQAKNPKSVVEEFKVETPTSSDVTKTHKEEEIPDLHIEPPTSDVEEKIREEKMKSIVRDELGKPPDSVVPESFIKLVEEILKKDLENFRESILELGIWDFAGQGLYYTCHKVFLSSASIFIVAFDLSMNMNKKAAEWTEDDFTNGQVLEFWLDSIYTYTKSSRPLSVLLVGTHAEGNEDGVKQAYNYIWDILKKKPYLKHIVPGNFEDIFFTVENSCEFDQNSEAQKLKRYIMEKIIPEILKKRGKRPLSWVEFEKNIKTLKTDENQEKQFATLNKVKELAVQCNVIMDENDEETLMTVLQFLHDIGSIIFYGKDDTALKNLVVLKPEWLLDVFKKLIIVPKPLEKTKFVNSWKKLREKHILESSLMDYVLDDLKETKSSIVELMKKYDFLCERVRGEETTYYVPFVLVQGKGNNPAANNIRTQPQKIPSSSKNTTFVIHFFNFVPAGLFIQLAVKTLKWSEKCREAGADTYEPSIYYRSLSAYIKSNHIVNLEWMKNAEIKVIVKNSSAKSPEDTICHLVLEFLKTSLVDLKHLQTTMGLVSFDYKFYIDLADYPKYPRDSNCGCRPRLCLQACLESDGHVPCPRQTHLGSLINVSFIRKRFTHQHDKASNQSGGLTNQPEIERSNELIISDLLWELSDVELRRFKFFLTNTDGPRIARGRMEHANQEDLAQLIVSHFQPVKMLKCTLKKALFYVPRQNLIKKLDKLI